MPLIEEIKELTMEHHHQLQSGKQEASKLRKGSWLEEEDETLIAAISVLGERRWDALAKASGLRRSGKSCRLRWMNYLRPNLKHGQITQQEETLIIQLHKQWGNRWSRIARSLPGRTDNEIKNYWRSYLRKKASLVRRQEDTIRSTTSADRYWEQKKNSNVDTESQDFSASSSSDTGDHTMFGTEDSKTRTSAEYFGAVEALSGIGSLAYSPYENRVLLDWTSSNCSRMEIFGDEISLIWDSTFSIWDMD